MRRNGCCRGCWIAIMLVVAAGLASLGCGEGGLADGSAGSSSSSSGSGGRGSGGSGGMEPALPDGAPNLFFTDLDSAPAGAYLTVWGKNFGGSEGVIEVGEATAEVVSWSPNRLELRVPGNGGQGVTVVVGGARSNTLPFVTRPQGHIYYVAAADGDNNADGLNPVAGAGSGPWRDFTAVLDHVVPGDVVYVREGVYDDGPDLDTNWGSVLAVRRAENSGEAGLPIAVVAYPGESPVVGHPTARRGVIVGDVASYWTIAKLTLVADSQAFQAKGNDGIRFVGNIAAGIPSFYGTVSIGGNHDIKILGNHIFDSGQAGNKLSHLVYYGGWGSGSGVEIAWNVLHDELGGRCIQVYGHTQEDDLVGLSIHDNYLYNCPYDAIVAGGSDDAPPSGGWVHDADFYNNAIFNAGHGGIRLNGPLMDARIAHNTLVDNGTAIRLQRVGTVEIVNNIMMQQSGDALDAGVDGTVVSMHHNGYFGGSGAASFDSQPFEGDPQFQDAPQGDYRLTDASPFLGVGAEIDPPLPQVSVPYDGRDLGTYVWKRARVDSPAWP